MKRIVFFLLCICATLLCLAACGNTPTTTTASCSHEFSEWEISKAASCTEKGLNVSICALCGEDKFEWIDMIPHKDENGDYRCDVCNVIVPYSEGLAYTLSGDGTYYIVSNIGLCQDTDLWIPPTHEGLPVKAIKKYAFYYCDRLTSVVISNSVTSIGNYAFSNCRSLTSVEIPDSVTSIRDYAFAYCRSLTSVVIGDSVTSIGDYAFNSCSSLTSVEIPNSVTSIGDYAFEYCRSLTSITIPDSVTSIEDYAFAYCDSLSSVEIPDSVTTIGFAAFADCTSLTSIEIPDSVTSIGNYAFSDCRSLTSVVIPDSVTSIGSSAFSNCGSLTSVTFENPNGWWYSMHANATSGTGISAANLANPATAAQYLKSTYYLYYWFRD